MKRSIAATAWTILMANCLFWGQQMPAIAEAAIQSVGKSEASVAAEDKPDMRSSRQKLLDDQAQRLVTMANDLKVAVDKTNKNILSLDVVRKAEEIESLAHKMKEQAKK